MSINVYIKDEKLKYDINKKVARKSELSSSKIDKCENLTCKEILVQKKLLGNNRKKPGESSKKQSEA